MARKKRKQRKHAVKVNLQVFELSKAGTSLELEILADDQKLGDITIGRGSIIWHGYVSDISARILHSGGSVRRPVYELIALVKNRYDHQNGYRIPQNLS